MNPYLKSVFRQEHLELAASIGQQGGSLQTRVEALFRALPDPLLASSDVKELLAAPESPDDVDAALSDARTSDVLESSATTLRPRDPDGIVLYRLKGQPVSRLKLLAIESVLSDRTSRFQFTCEGRLIRSIARVDRLDALSDSGQQREEIAKHVEQISKGIRDGTQVPNSLLLVLSETQIAEDPGDGSAPKSFVLIRPLQEYAQIQHPETSNSIIQHVRLVELDFPFRAAAFDEEKPALLVDGQQRTAALSSVDVDAVPEFSFSVNAVVAGDEDAKRVFQVANSTVRISVQFSRALTATMTETPGYLRAEADVAKAVKMLALHLSTSPFRGHVQYPGVKQQPRPPIAYNSLFHVVQLFHQAGLPFADSNQLAAAVSRGYNLVKAIWPEAWGKKPEQSRLMHGVGLRATAALLVSKLDAAIQSEDYDLDPLSDHTWAGAETSLSRLKAHLAWTDQEAADATKTAANYYRKTLLTAQNTNQDIAEVTSHIRMLSTQLDLDVKKAKAQKVK